MKKSSVPSNAGAAPLYYPMAPAGGVQLPSSEAVQLHDTLYVSGQIGLAAGTLAPVAGGIVPEAHQAIKNLKDVLERHGSGPSTS